MTLKNRELFVRDPAVAKLMNNGQARINEGVTAQERQTLREELSNFVCEGQYEDGTIRILESYLRHLNGTSQPAAWVSGFYGSGKSHLLKMLCHLWVDTEFEDGGRARALVPDLPEDVAAALKELDTEGRRLGGLHAVSGTLPSGSSESVRLTILGIILRSKGLPEKYAQAKFCLYLKHNGFYDRVKSSVEANGKDFFRELNNLYVSPILHDALIEVDPGYGDRRSARETLKAEFRQPQDISTGELLQLIREVLTVNGQLPCTVIVLDEVQIYIGDSKDRARDIVDVAEALCKQLDSRVMLIGAGQNALAAQAPHFKWLQDRFTISVDLTDADVETVTRRVLLQKRPEHVDAIRQSLELHAGEIQRHLAGTRISSTTSDRSYLVDDYPLLPVRRRLWEHVFRAVDPTGTSGMLRSQLRIIYDALKGMADKPLGTVVPADFMFDQLQPNLVQQGVLLRELDETIRSLDDGTEAGKLKQRLCGLIFLIRKLPREGDFDIGVRATHEMLADLMVSDLRDDGATLRKKIPDMLEQLVEHDGVLLKDGSEYNLQTKEYSEWDKEFRNRESRLRNQESEIHAKRDALIRAAAHKAVKPIQVFQGARKEKRKLAIHFGDEAPPQDGDTIPIWIRDGYSASEKNVLDAARDAGMDSPIVFVFLPRGNADTLRNQILRWEAANGTIQIKGEPSTKEGEEARDAMHSRRSEAERARNELIAEIIDNAKVFKGGGTEMMPLTIDEKIKEAASDALDRMFPQFKDADHKNWTVVIGRAKNGDEAPLQAVNWKGETSQHPVCKTLLREIGSGCEGRALQSKFGNAPYGWPQDVVDGALMALHNAGDVTVRSGTENIAPGKLDQTKIKRAEFRKETVTLSATDKIKLRRLFQAAGLTVKPSDDLEAKSSEFLQKLAELAARAGGDSPLPQRPSIVQLDDLRAAAGNERLAQLLDQQSELEESAKSWRNLSELAEKRTQQWRQLERLLRHGADQPEFASIVSAAEGIRQNRLLLDPTDHVTPLLKQAAGVLRTAVVNLSSQFESAHRKHGESLAKNEAWQKIDPDKQHELLATEGLDALPAVSVGTDEELVRTLDATPLSAWKDKGDALAARFTTAATKAARLLEPKLQRVHLSSGTLKTEAEVKQWLAEQEQTLLQKLKEGPIVVA